MSETNPPLSEKPLRVLLLAHSFPNPLNETSGVWAFKQAQALVAAGVDLRVLCFVPWVPRLAARSRRTHWMAYCPISHRYGNLPVEYPRWLFYPVNPLRGWHHAKPRRQVAWAWWSAKGAIRRAIGAHRPDLIFAHHTALNGALALRAGHEAGLPYVLADWDYPEVEDCATLPARRAFCDPILRGAGCVVATSLRMEGAFQRIFPGVNARAVHLGAPPIAEATRNKPRPAELAGKTVIFSASTFAHRKGMPLLTRAFARVAQEFPEAVLRLAGAGYDWLEVEKLVQELGLAGRLQLPGRLPHEQVLQEMVWCDVFALPSWDEPFATVFVEALSAGRPIIFAGDGGIADLARDGVHGLAVVPKDQRSLEEALRRLLGNSRERQEMGRNAGALFEKELTLEAHARKLMGLFREALGG